MVAATPFRCVLRDAEDRVLHDVELWGDMPAAAVAGAEALSRQFDPTPHVYEVWQGGQLLRRALSMRDGTTLPLG